MTTISFSHRNSRKRFDQNIRLSIPRHKFARVHPVPYPKNNVQHKILWADKNDRMSVQSFCTSTKYNFEKVQVLLLVDFLHTKR